MKYYINFDYREHWFKYFKIVIFFDKPFRDNHNIFSCEYDYVNMSFRSLFFYNSYNEQFIKGENKNSVIYKDIKTLFINKHPNLNYFFNIMKSLKKKMKDDGFIDEIGFFNVIDDLIEKVKKYRIDEDYIMLKCGGEVKFISEIENDDKIYYIVKNNENNIEMTPAEDIVLIPSIPF